MSRTAHARLLTLARGFPVVVVTGLRQSGKTTLVRAAFPQLPYCSQEDPEVRERALRDGRGFLQAYPQGAVFDEVQHAPELLSYLQTVVDATGQPGLWVLTGSQNLLLSAAVSQSFAGRAGFMELLPLAWHELPLADRAATALDDWLLRGGYPALWQRPVAAGNWLSSYLASYVERDVCQISRVVDLMQFQRFMRMMAARAGQLLNLNAVANDLSVAQITVRDWLAVLEASYIFFRLPPYHTNFGRRLVKTPKLYFHDTGLAAWLLGITDARTMQVHPMRGALFENMLVVEYLKHCRNGGLGNGLYLWRDNIGNEVDLLIERAGELWPVEMKSGATFQPAWLRSLQTWQRHAQAARQGEALLISATPGSGWQQGVMLAKWRDALMMLAPAT